MKRQQKGMRGGFVAGGELAARGLIVLPTSGSAVDVDLLVTDAAWERAGRDLERARPLVAQPTACLGRPLQPSRRVHCAVGE
jgi:hypothetical protein